MPAPRVEHYQGNPRIKRAGIEIEFEEWQVEEYIRCSQDPIYFIRNYVKIINVDRGLMPFEMFDFQERLVTTLHNNRFVVGKQPRQTGKSTTIVSYFLWLILFRADQKLAILANKGATSVEILQKIRLAYEHIPFWLQQGVLEWNKSSIQLENQSKIIAASTSSDSVRGQTFNMLLLDEFAFVNNQLAEDFFTSTFPTISSGKTTKLFVISTPNGMNHFYKLWMDAVNKISDYIPFEVHWTEVPGRDQAWLEEQIRNTSQRQVNQEVLCLAGETEVTIRDKNTGLIETIPIEHLYKRL